MNFKINISVLLLILVSIFTGCQRGEHSIFVVPENYTGYILVIYNQENGADKEYQDKSRVYRIPSDGILLSKFPNNPGWSGFPKFYQGSIAPENEIPYIFETNDVSEDKVSASGGSSGYASRDSEGKEGIRYVQFFIGNRSQIRDAFNEVERLDIRKLVDEQ